MIVPVWYNIEWINADFHRTNFSPRKFAYSVSAETCSQRNFVRNIGFGRSPTSVFEFGFEKIGFKNCEVVPDYPACCDCKLENFLSKKITARIKWNLKMDGLDRKMIFKFGKHLERLHSTRKQCRRIYICLFCAAKYLLGTPKPLNCIRWMQT